MLANVALALLAAPLALGRPQESSEHQQGRVRRQLGADPLTQSCHVRTRTYLSTYATDSPGNSGGYAAGEDPGYNDPANMGTSFSNDGVILNATILLKMIQKMKEFFYMAFMLMRKEKDKRLSYPLGKSLTYNYGRKS